MKDRQLLDEEINKFLGENGITKYSMSDKSRIRLLNAIAIKKENDRIMLEQHFVENKKNKNSIDLNSDSLDNYLNSVHNLEICSLNAKNYSYSLQEVVSYEKKELRKAKVRKFFNTMFRK